MGRRKIVMERIKNERSRNLTHQKRKKGLEKKAEELSTLCQVKICMIIYGDKQHEEPATLWPEEDTVRSLIELYRGRSDDDRRLRTHDLSFYFRELVRKVEMESAKLRKRNHETKYPKWDQRYNYLSTDKLKQLAVSLEKKIEDVKRRLEILKGTQTISLEDMYAMSNHGKQATQPCVTQSSVRRSRLRLEIMEQQQQQPLVPPMNFPEISTHHVGPLTELVPFGHHMMTLHNNNVEKQLGVQGMMRDQNMLFSNVNVDHQYPPQPVCYFVPVTTPTNYFHYQYPLLPNAAASSAMASYQMYASQWKEYYEMPDHSHLPNTMK